MTMDAPTPPTPTPAATTAPTTGAASGGQSVAASRRRTGPAHVLRVLGIHARIAVLEELQYRSNFWTYLVNTLVTLGVSLASLALVYRSVDELNGWTSDDLLVVVGVFFALGAVINGVIHSSMSKLVADIRKGDFDFRLLKPIDAQLLGTVQKVDGWRALDLVVGIVVIVVGLARGAGGGAGGATLAVHVAQALGMFVLAVLIVAGFWTLLSSITFWTVQGEGILWALDDMYEHLRWPISIFPGGLRLVLSTIFPAGLAVTVPAEALTGRLDWASTASAIALAAVMVGLSRVVWLRALARYEGASS
jgi:ABC-2 type transport system permease protein